jgi:S1-C subfamily serine protease
MIRCYLRLAGLFLLLLGETAAWGQQSVIRKSLCRISNTAQEPNYRTPWLPGPMGGGTGTGWVVNPTHVMTNAHVVSNARFLTLEKENDPRKYIAEVEFIAHDCDLALLKVKDASFFAGTVPLALGPIPEIESAVTVFGYPIGGDRLSVTRGIVSRVDFRTYSHSVMDSHLTIQIDAAINPGNSGGPVMQQGKVVGVAFQGFSGDVAQNVGYMIPTPVIRHFLKDIEDGHYDRYMDLSIGIFNTLNPAMRHALGLADDERGVLVTSVAAQGVCAGVLQKGDVIVAVDDHPVASDGMVELEGEHVLMAEVAERKFLGDTIKFSVIREKKPLELTATFDHAFPYTIQANAYDVLPTYVLYGGLLFQPLTRDLITTYRFNNLRLEYFFDSFISRDIYKDHPEIIVLSAILPDPINTYLGEFREGVVDEINGQKIRTLRDMSEALGKKPDFFVIKFIGNGRPLVLDRAAVEAAQERIRSRYNVLSEQNLSETPAS